MRIPTHACMRHLGTTVERSVGEITEEMLENADSNPGGMSKDAWLEYNVQLFVVEEHQFDLLSMGRPEGSGCYCYANNLVRGCLDDLQRGYQYVVMDNEAGLEHLSRRTTRDVDVLLMVADPSVRGIRTAATLNSLADELKIAVGARYLIVNRAEEPLERALLETIASTGVPFLGTVPSDPGITGIDLSGDGVFALPADSEALAAVRELTTVAIGASGAESLDPVLASTRTEKQMTARIIDGKAISASAQSGDRRARDRTQGSRYPARPGRRHRRRGPGVAGLRPQQGQGVRGDRDPLGEDRDARRDDPGRASRRGRGTQRPRRHQRHPRPVPPARAPRRGRGHRGDPHRQGRRRVPPREHRPAAGGQGHLRVVHPGRRAWCCSRRAAST